MHKSSNYLIGLALVLGVGLVGMPARASGLTSSQVNAILMLLQSFGADQSVIANVQADLASTGTTTGTPQASTTPIVMPPGQVGKALCIQLNRNLSLGAHGDDVKSLQEMLAEDPEDGFTARPTGYFGPLTAKALAMYQLHNGIISSAGQGGIVGPMTRGFFERHCGEGLGHGDNQQGQDRMQGIVGGTITAVGSSTITIAPPNPSNSSSTIPMAIVRTINITASTTIDVVSNSAVTNGSIANLTVGTSVTVAGVPNQDGSYTALEIGVGVLPRLPKGGDERQPNIQDDPVHAPEQQGDGRGPGRDN